MTTKPKVKIENWHFAPIWGVDSPEVLWGNCFGHPLLQDGLFIHTSSIVKKDLENKTVETLNTIYELGEPHETLDTTGNVT